MQSFHEPDGARARSHNNRFRYRTLASITHSLYEVTVGYSRRSKEHVVAGHEIVGRQHLIEVVAVVNRLVSLLLTARPQPALDHAAQAFDRARSDNSFWRASDAEEHVDARALARRCDRACNITIRNELDPCTGLSDFLHDALVPLAIQDDDRQVRDVAVFYLGNALQVFGDAGLDVDDVCRRLSCRDLLHVHTRPWVEHGPPLGE